MKRLFVLFCLILFALPAFAEDIDLDTMSTEELLILKNRINSILIERTDVYKEVRVPRGVWEVGVHIPAGEWRITYADPNGEFYVDITIGNEISEYTNSVIGERDFTILHNTEVGYTFTNDITEIIVTLSAGQFVEIDGPFATFSPRNSVRDLGFDW